jgi:D-alanyl-D-alanine carboxypeptidase/D-alanyl-D-alanine-endopeptidase (penicillin-binding protein 4)
MVIRLTLAIAALLLASCASTLPARIESITRAPSLEHALWGIDVEDEDGRVVYAKNAGVLMIPASNRKLFSAATAAECLGFDHRFATELWLDGEDLILRGGGDPSLGGRYYPSSGHALMPLVDAVHAHGLTHVRDVIADVSLFDRQTIPPSWKVGNLSESYSAPVDALAYGENDIEGAAITDPALHAARALRDLLTLDGVAVEGDVRLQVHPERSEGSPVTPRTSVNGSSGAVPPEILRFARDRVERLAVVESPPLWMLLTTMLKNSQNLYAEMLFKGVTAGEPASYASSHERELRFANELGIDSGSLHFVDGSGLSPEDLVTPAALVKLLRWMNVRERRGVWWLVLAAPNQEGTLHRRLIELESRMRGKTGTLSEVNALSGIVSMPGGRYRYFSIIVDHHNSDDATKAIDAVVRAISE